MNKYSRIEQAKNLAFQWKASNTDESDITVTQLLQSAPNGQSVGLKESEVKPWSQDWHIAAGAYPGLCSTKRLRVFLLPLVHHRSLPRNLLGFPNNLPVPICTPGWREAL